MKREFLKVFSVYDLLKYEAIDIFTELEIGTEVKLIAQDNKILVIKELEEGKEFTLGVLLDSECDTIKPFVVMNWADDLFQCKICDVNKGGNWDQKIKIVVYVAQNPKNPQNPKK